MARIETRFITLVSTTWYENSRRKLATLFTTREAKGETKRELGEGDCCLSTRNETNCFLARMITKTLLLYCSTLILDANYYTTSAFTLPFLGLNCKNKLLLRNVASFDYFTITHDTRTSIYQPRTNKVHIFTSRKKYKMHETITTQHNVHCNAFRRY